ncbi:MAG: 5'-3' exonuclease H3TH domain-containing protein [Pseudomonadales bacterium]
MSTLHLVDASIYVFRAYYSMPPNFNDVHGNLIHALYGYAGFLLDLKERGVSYGAVAFDESLTTCYRNQIYPGYKANRELPDDNLKYQFAQCQTLTRLLGFESLCLFDYEADDIIGSLAKQHGTDHDLVIVTRDKDLGQLLRSNDVLWDFASDEYMGPVEVAEKFGVPPQLIADFLALAGDSVDDIPGAPGIGAKTAATLLNAAGSLEQLLADPGQVLEMKVRGAKRLAGILEEHKENLQLYRRITEIYCDIPLDLQFSDLTVKPISEDIWQFCDEMKFADRTRRRIEALMT